MRYWTKVSLVTGKSAAPALVFMALVFAPPSAAQVQQAKLTADDAAAEGHFGQSVAISGDTAVAGSLTGGLGGALSGAANVYVRSGTSWTQQAKLTPDDAAAGDQFGFFVAIDGDTIVVGSPLDDQPGVINTGSAYVFVRSGTTWSQQGKFVASDAAQGDRFGHALSVDGDTALIGAYVDDDAGTSSGSAYVFVRSGTTWSAQAKLTADDAAAGDLFGESLSISGDTAAIGSHLDDDSGVDSGSAYVFVRSGTAWSQQAKLMSSDGAAGDHFAESIALLEDTVIVGSVHVDGDRGAGYVFVRDGSSWSEQARLSADDGDVLDLLGFAVALAPEVAVLGCFLDDDLGTNSGSTYLFTRDGTSWSQRGKLLADDGAAFDQFAQAVAASGNTAVVGAFKDDDAGSESGSAYVFLIPSSPWVDLGGGSPGANGVPLFGASGLLSAGSNLTLELEAAAPVAPMLVWLSFTSLPLSVLGGTLHANPPSSQFMRFSDAAGAWSESTTWPPGIPVGTEFFLQVLIQDLSVPDAITLSNALSTTTP